MPVFILYYILCVRCHELFKQQEKLIEETTVIDLIGEENGAGELLFAYVRQLSADVRDFHLNIV